MTTGSGLAGSAASSIRAVVFAVSVAKKGEDQADDFHIRDRKSWLASQMLPRVDIWEAFSLLSL
jgi:hypothetical protein